MPNYKRGGKAIRRSTSKESKRMYTQEQYDMAMNRVTVPQARRKMTSHYGGTMKGLKDYMGNYKPTGGVNTGTTKVATTPGRIGSRKSSKGKMKY